MKQQQAVELFYELMAVFCEQVLCCSFTTVTLLHLSSFWQMFESSRTMVSPSHMHLQRFKDALRTCRLLSELRIRQTESQCVAVMTGKEVGKSRLGSSKPFVHYANQCLG